MDDAIRVFAVEARAYCSLVESIEPQNSWTFAHACLSRVLRLYETALCLPELEPEAPDLLTSISYHTWEAMRQHTGRTLARDYHWAVFEPLEEEKPDPVVGSLPDDLSDIWRDLKPGLAVIDHGTACSIRDAAWQWRSSFETHWGHHAAGAVAALHALSFGQFADQSRP